MIKKFLQRFVEPRVEVQVMDRIVTRDVFIPEMVCMDPEVRAMALLNQIKANRTDEVKRVLDALWNLYQLDAVRAACPKADGEPEQVIRMADAGHTVLLGCIELVDGIDEEIQTQREVLLEREKVNV